MNAEFPDIGDGQGFTLIEILVTIVIAAILSAILVQFLGTALTRGGDSAFAVRTEAETGNTMEKILSDYVKQINTDPANALEKIRTTAYGSAVTMGYISFDSSGQETPLALPATSDTLKVEVEQGGYKMTTLLTNSRRQSNDPISQY